MSALRVPKKSSKAFRWYLIYQTKQQISNKVFLKLYDLLKITSLVPICMLLISVLAASVYIQLG